MIAARENAGGFWIALGSGGRLDELERWFISPTGAVTQQGSYASLGLSNYYVIPGQPTSAESVVDDTTSRWLVALDSNGVLYESAWIAGDKKGDVIYRRPLKPNDAKIWFSEAKTAWLGGTSNGAWIYAVRQSRLFSE